MIPWLGVGVASAVVALGLGCLLTLGLASGNHQPSSPLFLASILRFSLLQATLSATLSTSGGLVLALALWRLSDRPVFVRFLLPGLLHLSGLMIVIPTTVLAHGLMLAWGRNAPLAFLRDLVDLPLFGLFGILLAHVMLNLPLCLRLILPRLLSIPEGLHRQSLLLGLSPVAWARHLALPLLSSAIIGAFGLVFLFCFTSFALVLILGGGPAAANFEVAIFEAVRFELDFSRAATLALIQLGLCLLLLLVLPHKTEWIAGIPPTRLRLLPKRPLLSLASAGAVAAFLLLILPPLLLLLWRGLGPEFLTWLTRPVFLQSMLTSLGIALAAGLGCVLVSLLLIEARTRVPILTTLAGNLFLCLPAIVFGTGVYLMLLRFDFVDALAPVIVVLAGILFTLPIGIRILSPPIEGHRRHYQRLSQSLGLSPLHRRLWGEWRAARPAIALTMSLGAAFSLGDLGVIALFQHQDFTTVPWLLYATQGRYRADEAAALALWLMPLVLVILWLGRRASGHHHASG